ncbi:hypothetical protein SAMN05421783_11843 [Thiocapsa roseopersicina]|uniref:Uncharacterized protein n=1 Tax=Thiocapsa roseopersicina TaxID=1058 RepID=A0A1H3A397_THIRO|nr:hypothetical protein SAMN05421783_11843 [Thiocapsa roseopersicina]
MDVAAAAIGIGARRMENRRLGSATDRGAAGRPSVAGRRWTLPARGQYDLDPLFPQPGQHRSGVIPESVLRREEGAVKVADNQFVHGL